jgi:two-component system, LytTR family, response regulator
MNTCIIDDSELARAELNRFLKPYREINVISEAGSYKEAVQMISETSPELIFLDIDLTDGDGFQVLNETPKNVKVIFTTAFDEFAIRAFDVNAVDYLLKPIDPARLDEAINKALTISTTIVPATRKTSLFIK